MNNSTKAYSNKQESLIAAALGWEQVCGSGARPCIPGDVIGDEWLGECKTHTSKVSSILFDSSVWTKICDEAAAKHRKPVLFADNGTQDLEYTWCLCYEHSIENRGSLLVQKYPYAIRKNISFNQDKLANLYSATCKANCGDFYRGTVFKVDEWGKNVVIIPFKLFKELIK